DGVTRGIVLYRVSGGDHEFTTHKVNVEKLVAETPDAYAALWRFLIEMDLVQEVSADLRATDEPLRWQLSDWRGATVKTYDHQWLRILDVVGAFTERAYVGEGRLALDVTDSLGYAEGKWLLTVEGDDPSVELVETIPRDVAALSMTANELAALYLGGVSAVNLAAARFVTESHPGDAILADSILRSPVTPWLSVWY
ncbi:MAG TPA: sterol carrier protein domain-containing protein, partial [Vicinamibacterales bacterium]|nr:sterol carrier protein domain-containing protein [Vicinamibacterales bacterium]